MNADIFRNHHFELSDLELAQFEKFLALFILYNTHTNLSAIRDEEGIVEKHFLDSLYGSTVISDHQKTKNQESRTIRLIDIGSG